MTLSKAFEKSSRIISVCLPTLVFLNEHDELGLTRPFFSEAMLEVIHETLPKKVLNNVGSQNVFKDLAKNASEGDRLMPETYHPS